MKKSFLIIVCFVFYQSFAQNIVSNKNDVAEVDNIPFFDGNSFILDHFLINDERVELELTHHNGQGSQSTPYMIFNFSTETNILDAEIGGYCNGTSAKYEISENYLTVISRGGTTLMDCGSGEETDFFDPITGNIYMQQPPEKVYYQITEDNLGLWLWMIESHKLYFTKGTLSINEFNLDKQVQVFPNPANKYLTIESVKTNIQKVSIFNTLGKEILTKLVDFDNINVSNLERGIYFVKIKTDLSTLTKKIIIQ